MIEAFPDQIDDEIVDSKAEVGEKAGLMRRAMELVQDEFSARDWNIFCDVAIDDKDRKDTAEKYGVSDNSVYLAISRIKKRLREIFEDLLDDDVYPQTPDSDCD